jgi:hypothetical protein
MIQPGNYAIFVNSTDSFEDCWVPFFTLFCKYWTDQKRTIYLNTEKKDFGFPNLNIHCIKNNLFYQRNNITWSECLYHALEIIKEDLVLYLQEDYFLTGPVKKELILELVDLMQKEPIDCIQLTNHATPGPFVKSKYQNLSIIDQKATYRISTQASLWKKEILKKYIRKHETGWLFEYFGTKRAYLLKHNFFIIDPVLYDQKTNPIVPYFPTGIVKGKWSEEAVVQLFINEKIDIDFEIRGFYSEKSNDFLKRIFRHRLVKERIISNIDLIKMKLYA